MCFDATVMNRTASPAAAPPADRWWPAWQQWAAAGWFLVAALLTRLSVLGETGYFNDESFYLLAGQRMHDGLIPYVDIWDRKGPGLLLTYYLITGISRSVLAYQLAALACAAATAFVLCRVARRWTGLFAALAAGTLYLLMLPAFGGAGGQSPVFYNLWMVLAVWLVLRAGPQLAAGSVPHSALAAMALAGLAITYKQTALFEAAYLGLVCLWLLQRAGQRGIALVRSAMVLLLAGAAPLLVFALAFALAGHFAAFWQAMVTSNLLKSYASPGNLPARLQILATLASPALISATIGLILPARHAPKSFIAGWVVAALLGVVIIPNLYEHYMLPLLPSLCIAAALLFDRGYWGLAAATAAGLFYLGNPVLRPTNRAPARAAMAMLEADISARDRHPRLFVFQGPMNLYRTFDSFPPSPLADNFHLYFDQEDNVSPFDTAGEVRKILAWRPTVVIMFAPGTFLSGNTRTVPLVQDYVNAHCQFWFQRPFREIYVTYKVNVYGNCGRR
jgi:hypothetical protein